MRLIAKVISILLAKFHYNRLTIIYTATQDIQDYASLILGQFGTCHYFHAFEDICTNFVGKSRTMPYTQTIRDQNA